MIIYTNGANEACKEKKKTFHLVFMAVESIKEKNNIDTDTHAERFNQTASLSYYCQ